MKKNCFISAGSRFLSAAFLLAGFVNASLADDVQLFNGKDFSNWHGRSTTDPAKWDSVPAEQKAKWDQEIKDHWKIDGDVIVSDGHGAFLTTNQEFGDFEFSFDYSIVPTSDSGVYLRGIPQVQIWDPNAENNKKHGNEKGSGGLWNNPPGFGGKDPLVRADKPVGEWNAMRVRLIGERCTVWLNGLCVVKNERLANYFRKGEPLYAKGPIQLQTHGAEIRWRNLKLKEFNSDQANELLRAAEDESLPMTTTTTATTTVTVPTNSSTTSTTTSVTMERFVPLFNGKDLTGWKGATDNYSVVDGTIQCKTGKGGTLVSEKAYSDYVMRVDFLLPPGGNNGLVMRYPSQAEIDAMPKDKRSEDGAYVAMTELQVLDDGHSKYKNLDPRQAHGSAYGIAPAKRGFLRPTGQWNHEVITVVGSTIIVELNGTRILETDVSTINEYMAESPHPGKNRKSGHVGFAGHNDPVQFRNVDIRSIAK